jgi:hypothetical protein
MRALAAGDVRLHQAESDFAGEILHALSQPVTALECGLELALCQKEKGAQLCARLESLLDSARLLHQRLTEVRALEEAGDPGDTNAPVAVDVLLAQLREDFLPVASSLSVKLSIQCGPTLVFGNALRLQNGLFQLIDCLLRCCPSHGTVRLAAGDGSGDAMEIGFRICGLSGSRLGPTTPDMVDKDLGLRLARRSFQSIGGNLLLRPHMKERIAGSVRLLLSR